MTCHQPRFSPTGSFCFEADIDEITYAVVDLSYYEAYIYLEPGAKYVVSLPPYRLRPGADRFNPYYEPSPIRLLCVRQAAT